MPEKPTYEELEKSVLELKKIELELQKVKKLLNDEISWRRLLIEESRDAIVVLDHNAKVLEANSRFAKMLGYSREEMYQLHAWDWDVHLNKDQILELAQTINNVGHYFETQHRRKDGSLVEVELSNNGALYRGNKLIFCICRDISDRKKAEKEREDLITRLQASLTEIKSLRGILPICTFCKNVRDDKGYWEQVDIYLNKHSEADISHSICPECVKKHYPDEYKTICQG
jgi:PAS domain S-box-containing protein